MNSLTEAPGAAVPGVPAPPPPALRAAGLSVTFRTRRGPVPAVRDVDLEVGSGELVALLGESGSGKSVTARALMGLGAEHAEVRADQLSLGDTDLLGLGDRQRREIRGARMSLVFQDAMSALNPVLSIGDQVGALFREHRGTSRRQAHREAVELLDLVGIADPRRRSRDYPHQFSGGMRQRILIAMGIALRPEVLIADEPTTALDVTVQAQILELLDRLRSELSMAVLLITHDLGVVCQVADRVMVMYAGRIVESSDADSLFRAAAHPYTEALFRSVPGVDTVGSRLDAIPGSPPAPGEVLQGCPFHPRCAWVVDRCRVQRPDLLTTTGGRSVACHRHEEVLRAR